MDDRTAKRFADEWYAEGFFLDDEGKVARYFAHYARPTTA